jgi:hypothetical protein
MDAFTVRYLVLWIVVIVEAALLLVVLRTFGTFYLSTTSGVNRDGLPVGSITPDFQAVTLDRRAITRESLRGRWAVLFFVDPMCQECYELLPDLVELEADLEGLARTVVMFRGEREDAEAFPSLVASQLAIVPIGRKGLIERFRVRASPFFQILDEQGVVRAKGLAGNRETVEHLISNAQLHHPIIDRHRREANGVGGRT